MLFSQNSWGGVGDDGFPTGTQIINLFDNLRISNKIGIFALKQARHYVYRIR